MPHITLTLPHITLTMPHIMLTMPHIMLTMPHITLTLPHIMLTMPRCKHAMPRCNLTMSRCKRVIRDFELKTGDSMHNYAPIENMGRYNASVTTSTIEPTVTIITGSSSDIKVSIVASTLRS